MEEPTQNQFHYQRGSGYWANHPERGEYQGSCRADNEHKVAYKKLLTKNNMAKKDELNFESDTDKMASSEN